MTDVNYDVKTGRLTKDVDIKEVNGKFVMQGSLAVNRSYKKGEEWVEETSFFNFKQWLKSEKQVSYYKEILKKGAQITIDGEMIQDRWKDAEGKNQSTYYISVNRIIPSFNSGEGRKNDSAAPTNDEGFPEDIVF